MPFPPAHPPAHPSQIRSGGHCVVPGTRATHRPDLISGSEPRTVLSLKPLAVVRLLKRIARAVINPRPPPAVAVTRKASISLGMPTWRMPWERWHAVEDGDGRKRIETSSRASSDSQPVQLGCFRRITHGDTDADTSGVYSGVDQTGCRRRRLGIVSKFQPSPGSQV